MMVLLLKHLHVTCVVLSISGFLLRGVWMMQESPWLQTKWVRVAPHIIDTILLVSAVLLAIQIQQYPFVQNWLTAKVLALIAYIMVGAVGLKYGRTKKIRIAAWLVAIAIFLYIVLVALSHQVLPFVA
ncbi:MAG TPA: SirB2 family protein [Sulfuricaulis sp.]|nr:SirB2 family protein [Sulfuricaulis sp.]